MKPDIDLSKRQVNGRFFFWLNTSTTPGSRDRHYVTHVSGVWMGVFEAVNERCLGVFEVVNGRYLGFFEDVNEWYLGVFEAVNERYLGVFCGLTPLDVFESSDVTYFMPTPR